MISVIAVLGLALAANVIHVGDKAMDGTFLKPYNNFWDVRTVDLAGNSTPNGTWTDNVAPTLVNGTMVLKRTQFVVLPNGTTNEYVNVFDPATMAPISSHLGTNTGGYLDRNFNRASINRKQRKQGKESHGSATLKTPFFDFNGGMYGVLLVCLPLEEHYKASFPAVNQFTETLESVDIEVVRKETLHTARGDFDCFVVEVAPPSGPMTFWLSKIAPYVLKLDAFTPGTGHTIWEIR